MTSRFRSAMVRQAKRNQERYVACPECGAQTGKQCRRQDGSKRMSNHRERIDAAKRAGALR